MDWCIRSDEHWAIVGANGSGKSVLARALYGAVPAVEGEIEYHFLSRRKFRAGKGTFRGPENFIAHVSFEDQRRLIGMESSYHQSRWNSIDADGTLTVRDVLSSDAASASPPRRSPGTQADGKRQRRMVKQLGIDHLLDRKIMRLSNGEVRKALIAKALLQSPLILMLDDPFVGLDYHSKRTLRRIIGELMNGNMRIVFVTSRIDEIPSGITHVLRLEGGRMAAAGKRKTVLDDVRSVKPSMCRKRTPAIRQIRAAPSNHASLKPKALIEVRNASVIYDGIEVLRKVNWMVQAGQNWALLGPNGSGKTTLLSLILADNPQAYSNDIYVFGRKRGSGESIWDIKKKIGWVSPEIQIHYQKGMTSYAIVCSGFFDSIGLYRRCSARQMCLASSCMETLGLSRLADRRYDELSSGQQRMVLIARASVKNPRLLILDEPCQGLDPENRRLVLEAVDVVGRRSGSVLIYVTHHLDEIPESTTHVLRLRKGRVVGKGERIRVLGE